MLTSKYDLEYTYLNGMYKCNLTIKKLITEDWLSNWDLYHIKNNTIILYFSGTKLEVQEEIKNAEDDNFRRP